MSFVKLVTDFIKESNAIEDIHQEPNTYQIDKFIEFYYQPKMTRSILIEYVLNGMYGYVIRKHEYSDYGFRDDWGMNVEIQGYRPPAGNPDMGKALDELLEKDLDAYHLHVEYEKLHPFMDGNGRSGRALWAWKHRDLSLGFLRAFYYQTLANSR